MLQKLDDKTAEIFKAQQYAQNIFVITKELIENSLDAGAKNIQIKIKEDSICVSDDGRGIESLDFIAQEGFTSKLKTTKSVLGVSPGIIRKNNDQSNLSIKNDFLTTLNVNNSKTNIKNMDFQIQQEELIFSELKSLETKSSNPIDIKSSISDHKNLIVNGTSVKFGDKILFSDSDSENKSEIEINHEKNGNSDYNKTACSQVSRLFSTITDKSEDNNFQLKFNDKTQSVNFDMHKNTKPHLYDAQTSLCEYNSQTSHLSVHTENLTDDKKYISSELHCNEFNNGFFNDKSTQNQTTLSHFYKKFCRFPREFSFQEPFDIYNSPKSSPINIKSEDNDFQKAKNMRNQFNRPCIAQKQNCFNSDSSNITRNKTGYTKTSEDTVFSSNIDYSHHNESASKMHVQNKHQEVNSTENLDFTHGFRGQALFAISKICNLTITSRSELMTSATKKTFNTGNIEYCARNVGTTVMVEDIFYNCEIRKKEALKNIKIYVQKILNIIKAYCLVYEVKFTLKFGRNSYSEIGIDGIYESLKYRYENIFQEKQCLISDRTDFLLIFSAIGYKNKSCQFLIASKRPIKHQKILNTINNVCNKHRFRKHAAFVLCLKNQADFNISVDKTQIILKDETRIINTLKEIIDHYLSNNYSENFEIKNINPSQNNTAFFSSYFQSFHSLRDKLELLKNKPTHPTKDDILEQENKNLKNNSNFLKTESSQSDNFFHNLSYPYGKPTNMSVLQTQNKFLPLRDITNRNGRVDKPCIRREEQNNPDKNQECHFENTSSQFIDQNSFDKYSNSINDTIINKHGLSKEDETVYGFSTLIQRRFDSNDNSNENEHRSTKDDLDFNSFLNNFHPNNRIMYQNPKLQEIKILDEDDSKKNDSSISKIKTNQYREVGVLERNIQKPFACKSTSLDEKNSISFTLKDKFALDENSMFESTCAQTTAHYKEGSFSDCSNKASILNLKNNPPSYLFENTKDSYKTTNIDFFKSLLSQKDCSLSMSKYNRSSCVSGIKFDCNPKIVNINTIQNNPGKTEATQNLLNFSKNTNLNSKRTVEPNLDAKKTISKEIHNSFHNKVVFSEISGSINTDQDKENKKNDFDLHFHEDMKPFTTSSESKSIKQIKNCLMDNTMIHKKDIIKFQVIGQFNKGFILAFYCIHTKKYLVIIDQHAADEIKNFEDLQNNFYLKKQKLVVPLKLQFSADDMFCIKNNIEVFKRNGFIINDQDYLTAVPIYKDVIYNLDDLCEILESIKDDNETTTHFCSKTTEIMASKACRSSIMIGKTLTMNEMAQIVKNLANLRRPWNCPHGRPVMRILLVL